MNGERIIARAVELALEVHRILKVAYGPDLRGSDRGRLVSATLLAMIRDRFQGYEPEQPPQVCAECIALRARLVNIYHLTLTGQDAASTVTAIREMCCPGAPASSPSPAPVLPEEWVCVPCRVRDVQRCDADRCCSECGNDLVERAELLAFIGSPAPASAPAAPAKPACKGCGWPLDLCALSCCEQGKIGEDDDS